MLLQAIVSVAALTQMTNIQQRKPLSFASVLSVVSPDTEAHDIVYVFIQLVTVGYGICSNVS